MRRGGGHRTPPGLRPGERTEEQGPQEDELPAQAALDKTNALMPSGEGPGKGGDWVTLGKSLTLTEPTCSLAHREEGRWSC